MSCQVFEITDLITLNKFAKMKNINIIFDNTGLKVFIKVMFSLHTIFVTLHGPSTSASLFTEENLTLLFLCRIITVIESDRWCISQLRLLPWILLVLLWQVSWLLAITKCSLFCHTFKIGRSTPLQIAKNEIFHNERTMGLMQDVIALIISIFNINYLLTIQVITIKAALLNFMIHFINIIISVVMKRTRFCMLILIRLKILLTLRFQIVLFWLFYCFFLVFLAYSKCLHIFLELFRFRW